MMMFNSKLTARMSVLGARFLTVSLLCATALAQSATGDGTTTPPSTSSTHSSSHYRPETALRAREYYQLIWGVDKLAVRSVESGELIRFNYRVLDAVKAQTLNDKKSEPYLIDPRAGVRLVVPSLEKVGQLRQSSTPEAGKIYWMAFSNKGGLVKRGDRVNVVIGTFRADGLVVE